MLYEHSPKQYMYITAISSLTLLHNNLMRASSLVQNTLHKENKLVTLYFNTSRTNNIQLIIVNANSSFLLSPRNTGGYSSTTPSCGPLYYGEALVQGRLWPYSAVPRRAQKEVLRQEHLPSLLVEAASYWPVLGQGGHRVVTQEEASSAWRVPGLDAQHGSLWEGMGQKQTLLVQLSWPPGSLPSTSSFSTSKPPKASKFPLRYPFELELAFFY